MAQEHKCYICGIVVPGDRWARLMGAYLEPVRACDGCADFIWHQREKAGTA